MKRLLASTAIDLAALCCLAAAAAPAAGPPSVPASRPSDLQAATHSPPAATRPATVPATQASTRPATRPSLATPRDALKAMAMALRDGDSDALAAVALATGPEETQAVQGIGQMARALNALHAAAAEKFGPEAASQFAEDAALGFEQTSARIDAADVQVENTVARVRYPQASEQVLLQLVGNAWKVPASQFCPASDVSAMRRRLFEQQLQTQIIQELAAEIRSGKYRSADTAALAWRSKMVGTLGEPAATRPSSQPAHPG